MLLPLMVILIMSEPAYRYYLRMMPRDFSEEGKKLDSIVALWNADREKFTEAEVKTDDGKRDSLFNFNPNTMTISAMRSLGFADHLSNRIAGYRNKGGVFRIKRDLLKIYGMDSTFYQRLRPYIMLPEVATGGRTQKPRIATQEKKEEPEKFDLNKADTSTLKTIYGIGTALAQRIVKFRTRLGGFVDPAQVHEVFGLDSVVARRLRNASFIEPGFVPQKIDINSAEENTMASHPYIGRDLARAIVAYRFQHGKFINTDELKNIVIFSSRDADKLEHYLTAKE